MYTYTYILTLTVAERIKKLIQLQGEQIVNT